MPEDVGRQLVPGDLRIIGVFGVPCPDFRLIGTNTFERLCVTILATWKQPANVGMLVRVRSGWVYGT